MRRFFPFLAVTTAAFVLAGGCSHAPRSNIPAGLSCNLDLSEVEVAFPDEGADAYTSALDDAFDSIEAPMLFLSGGSQHGAFGAGYLDQWSKRAGGLPKFKLVTGISTGALQSTGAFIGETDMLIETAEITAESELLETYVDGSDVRDGFSGRAIRTLIRKGSVSDLVPLRERLDEKIDDTVLAKVAAAHGEGRKLFVGVTDFDDGKAYAVDMTELATRYVAAAGTQRHLKTCYHEVLVASSIVPVAAKPVFIDGRMYIDGGVRFAVLSDDIRKRADEVGAIKFFGREEPLVHVVMNGDGNPSTLCGKRDEDHCIDDNTVHPDFADAPHEKWNMVSLGARSVALLINQVGRLSADRALTFEDRDSDAVSFIRINENAKDNHPMSASVLPAGLLDAQSPASATCSGWREEDESLDDPVEFHPRYMRCLVSYGRSVADDQFDPDR